MNQDIMRAIFEQWVESENYRTQSVLENGAYSKCASKIKDAVGKEEYNRISDDVGELACDAEISGFNSGFQYGVMFMSGLLKGGVV